MVFKIDSFKSLILILAIFFFNIQVFGKGVSSDKPSNKFSSKEARVSLDIKGMEILQLLRVLSLKSGLTIVATSKVKGRVTLLVNNLTAEEVLDVLSISMDLAYERKGNLITVMTASEYEELYGKKFNERRSYRKWKLKYAAPQAVSEVLSELASGFGKVITDEASGTVIAFDTPQKLKLMNEVIADLDRPLESRVFNINYASVTRLEKLLTQLVTPHLGKVISDSRNGKIVVYDLPQRLEKIKEVLRTLDEADSQVFIQAEILQVTLKENYYSGIEWEKIFTSADWLDFLGNFSISGTLSSEGLSSYQTLSVGTLEKDKYNAVIKMLEDYGDVKVVSRPQVVAINNQEAKILVGSREAFISRTMSQGVTTVVTSENIDFVDVGIKLVVTPTINKEGFITMRIKPEISSVRETIETEAGSVVPIIETSEAETVAKVKDGGLIMIAGLSKEEDSVSSEGVPFISHIPILGKLTSSSGKKKERTELVILLRPTILRLASPVQRETEKQEVKKEESVSLKKPEEKKEIAREEVTFIRSPKFKKLKGLKGY